VTVRIAADVTRRILQSPGRTVIQVQDASDPEAAAEVLERARPEINRHALKGAREVERIPSGPFVMVVDREDGRRRLLAVPEVVARHLEDAGVDGTVACIEQGGLLTSSLWGLPTLGPAVVCRLYPPPPEIEEDPPTTVPDGWLAEAAAWLTDGLDGAHPLWSEVGLVEFSLAAGGVAGFLEQQRRHRRSALVVAARPRPDDASEAPVAPVDPGWFCGDLPGPPLRAAALCRGPSSCHLALGAGGPGASDLPAVVEAFTALARRLAAEVAYAFVDVSPTFLRFAGLHHPLEPFCDEAVFDGFPYQVLGPGHLERLGGPPAGARMLAGGRVEVAAGDLAPWIDEGTGGRGANLGPRRGMLRGPVQRLLQPCLALDGGVLRQERWERVKRRRLDLDDLAVPEYRFHPPRP
jgi:hypothetical protein